MLFSRKISLASIFTLFLAPATSQAGGIILYEISTADIRLASAGWSSRAEDPSTLFTNPAGMSRLQCPQFECGIQAIKTHINFDFDDETTITGSDGHANEWFPAGSGFYVHPLSDDLTVGFGLLGYFGADLKYNNNWVGRYYCTHSFLEGFSAVPAASYKLNDCLSVGVGANVMYGIFRQKSKIRNLLDDLPDGTLRLHDVDLSCGVVAGILYEMSPCTRIGLQYLSPVKFHFTDKPKFSNVGPLLEEALTVTGVINSQVKFNVEVPQNIILSLYHDFDDCWTFMADAGWQQWSRFQKVSVSIPSPDAPSITFTPKFEDTWHGAIGVEYFWNSCLKLSGGVAYDSSAVTNKNRPLDFPVGKQWRFGTGARWFYSENMIFDFCYEFQWQGSLPCNTNRGALAGRVDGEFKNTYIQFFDANLTWIF